MIPELSILGIAQFFQLIHTQNVLHQPQLRGSMYNCLGQKSVWVSKCQNSSFLCCIYTSPGTEVDKVASLHSPSEFTSYFYSAHFLEGERGKIHM